MNDKEIKERLGVLSRRKNVNVMIFADKMLIVDFYTDSFDFEKIEEYWEITLDNEVNTIYVDKGNFSDIDINLGLITIVY